MFDGAAFADLRVCIILVVHGDQHQPHDNGRRFHQRHDRYHVAMQMEPVIRDGETAVTKVTALTDPYAAAMAPASQVLSFRFSIKKVYRE